MNQFLVTVIVAIFVISANNAHADENTQDISVKIEESAEQSDNKVESVKQKRGIIGGYGYPVPTVGLHFQKYSPYARFPGVHRGLSGSYALTPGTASVQSYSVTYPKAYYSKSVLPPAAHPRVVYHSHPRTYYPSVYANRYPFVPKPVSFVPTPTFAAAPIPAFVPHQHSHTHVHPVIATNPFAVQPQFVPNVLPVSAPAPVFPQSQVPTLISQNGWRPVIQPSAIPQVPVYPQASIPQTPIASHVPHVPQVNRPSISVLPPLAAAGSGNTPNVNNFYLPPRHAGTAQINEHVYSNNELVQADGKNISIDRSDLGIFINLFNHLFEIYRFLSPAPTTTGSASSFTTARTESKLFPNPE